jgi:hypothetical protein
MSRIADLMSVRPHIDVEIRHVNVSCPTIVIRRKFCPCDCCSCIVPSFTGSRARVRFHSFLAIMMALSLSLCAALLLVSGASGAQLLHCVPGQHVWSSRSCSNAASPPPDAKRAHTLFYARLFLA